ncbi:MAG: plastocyanin/azurin family copper-binding protein [Acidimicrobiales bacterium]
MRRDVRRILGLAAIAGAALVGCGGDDGGDGGDGGAVPGGDGGNADVVVQIQGLDFDAEEYAAAAGDVAIEYVNDGTTRHDLLIEDVPGLHLEVGSTDSGTVELEPGTYTMFCSVPGHRSAGMEAELVVE